MLDSRLLKYNVVTISLAFLEFVTILCIPFVSLDGLLVQRISGYILATIFWLSILIECIFVHLSAKERRWIERKENHNKTVKYSPPGVISFFKSPEAIVADVILFVTATLVVILMWAQVKTEWIIITDISVLSLSFNLHCVLNGKNYRYLKSYRLYKKEQKQDE